ncbi:hypothetical protein [Intrasporangium mesophilum]
MMDDQSTSSPSRRRRRRFTFSVSVMGLVLAALALTVPRSAAGVVPTASHASHASHHAAATTSAPARALTAAQASLHDAMRKLWEDHVTWTRLAIVAFADGSAGFGPTANRLLANQSDIGKAIATFYGAQAGSTLTALLHDHITIAVELLQAAKAGDTAAFADAKTRWYANADQIADVLAAANPRNWPQATMRESMRMHLDQTLAEAAAELHGDYAASIAAYEQVHAHILAMADLLSDGIMRQFPSQVH